MSAPALRFLLALLIVAGLTLPAGAQETQPVPHEFILREFKTEGGTRLPEEYLV